MRPRATHLVLPAYIVAAIVYTWPLLLVCGHAIPATGGMADARAQAYLLGWDWHALAAHPLHVFDAPIFHPERNTLTYMDHLLGEAFLGAPVYAATRSVAPAYGFLVLFAFATAGWAAYRLARACGVSRLAAWLAGFLYSFSSYHFANLDQLNVLQIEALPLALWFALRCLVRGRWRDWLGLAASALLQVYLGWYYSLFLGLALVLLAAGALVRGRAELGRVAWGRAALAGALFAALAAPVALPYAAERRTLPAFGRTVAEVDAESPSFTAYVHVDRGAAVSRYLPAGWLDQAYWPGLVTLAGAAFARRGIGRRRAAAYFATLAACAFVLSLGPHLLGPHHRILPVPLPYWLFHRFVPGFAGLRAAGRLAVLVQLGLALLAALGLDRLRQGVAVRGGAFAARAVGAVLVVVALGEAWQRPLGTVELPTAATLPPVYAWLAVQPDAPPVLEVPGPAQPMNESELDVLRQYYALLHGKPRLDGASGFVSPRYRAFRALLRDFPAGAALDSAGALGARLVIVHWGDYAPPERAARQAALERAARLDLVATFGLDAVYRWRDVPVRTVAPGLPEH